jgi:hypothetical protein
VPASADDLQGEAHITCEAALFREPAGLEMAMKYCHVCQLSISETATFCATCGARVPDPAATQESITPTASAAAATAPVEATAPPVEKPIASPALATIAVASPQPTVTAASPSGFVERLASPPVPVLISPQGVLVVAPPGAAGAAPSTGSAPATATAFPARPAMAFPATTGREPAPPTATGSAPAAPFTTGGAPEPPTSPQPATATEAAPAQAAEPAPVACRICGRSVPASEDDDVCHSCRADLDLFVAAGAPESAGVSLAGSAAANGRQRVTAGNAIYSALADDDTCPACRAMDGRETSDIAVAAGWAPNRQCRSPQGCRCAVFYEHESLVAGEVSAFIAYAAAHGLHVTVPAVSAFHDETRRIRQAADRLDDASRSLAEARTLEKIDPEQAVTRYREAIDCLMACGESPLDERRVRRDLPLAFNRLTLVLKALGRRPEALDEIERAAAMGILDRDDCGRKADRDALLNRRQRLRESLTAGATA